MLTKLDPTWLRQFILSVVKPLRSGLAVTQSGDRASLDNVFPNNSYSDKFKQTSPFGFIAHAPRGVVSFYQGLFGSGYESIILGYLHAGRPQPTAPGETVLYSTTPDGATIKVKVSLKNDGSIVIDAPTTVVINATTDTIINCVNATIAASTKTTINSPSVDIGSGALEKIVNGETFKTYLDTHQHLDSFGIPTSAPIAPMPANALSNAVKAAK